MALYLKLFNFCNFTLQLNNQKPNVRFPIRNRKITSKNSINLTLPLNLFLIFVSLRNIAISSVKLLIE